jgi:hypothetical protein
VSILVPSQDELLHRACLDAEYYDLLDWFSAVEMKAWVAVNSYFAANRPKKLFLVTGQTLTSEYSITHKQALQNECEIHLEANAGVPVVAEANMLLGYNVKRVSASVGFEVCSQKFDQMSERRLYSVFLEVYESDPINFIRSKLLAPRLKAMYE